MMAMVKTRKGRLAIVKLDRTWVLGKVVKTRRWKATHLWLRGHLYVMRGQPIYVEPAEGWFTRREREWVLKALEWEKYPVLELALLLVTAAREVPGFRERLGAVRRAQREEDARDVTVVLPPKDADGSEKAMIQVVSLRAEENIGRKGPLFVSRALAMRFVAAAGLQGLRVEVEQV